VPVPSAPPRIAKRLTLAPGTVRNHMSHSITKLRARNRIDAILTAGENNWL
jgi:two-component system response regulator DesR